MLDKSKGASSLDPGLCGRKQTPFCSEASFVMVSWPSIESFPYQESCPEYKGKEEGAHKYDKQAMCVSQPQTNRRFSVTF